MSIKTYVKIINKSVWRDLTSISRYKGRLVGRFLETGIMLAGFLLIGGVFNFSVGTITVTGLKETDVFLFMASGVALNVFSSISTWAPWRRVNEDIYFGTLESVFVTPASRHAYLLSASISEAIINSIFFIPLYVLMLALVGKLTDFRAILLTLLTALIAVISLVAIGIFFAMLGMVFRQTGAIINVLHELIQFLCGAYLPVQSFVNINTIGGPILKYLAMLFPYTYTFDLMRAFLIGDSFVTLLPIWAEFIVIIMSTLLYLILAKVLLKTAEKKAKRTGLSIL
ncbi:MAG: ABC transporter permease [Asgard group archaeon]|nr:ABC transporter permease [Asgard group archaeon]